MAMKKENLSPEELLEQALVPEQEWPYRVPENWVWTYVNSITNLHRGVSYKKNDASEICNEDSCLVLRGGNIEEGSINIESDNIYVPINIIKENQFLQANDIIIVSSTGSSKVIGKAGISKENYGNVAFGAFLTLVRPVDFISKKLVCYFFQSDDYRNEIKSLAKGVNINNIKNEYIENLKFPLPPLAEQQRIVVRIESLFEKLDQAKGLIQDVLDSFENRKSAILHKAFSGELTKKWREENPTSKNMTLEQVLSHYKNNSISKHIKFIEVLQESCEKLVSVENSIWYKCKIGAVAVVTNGSTPSRQVLEFWGGNIPWVSSGEVRNNIIADTRERITDLGYDKSSVKLLPEGTVLMAMIGEGKTRGQSAILDINATINQNIAAIDLSHKMVLSKFVWYWLQKQYQNNREMGNGTGPQALNCQKIRELDIVIPPLKEQIEIVRILDGIMSSENSAKEISDLTDNIDLMKKSILARAFRGELETNDLAEESALALLKDLIR